MTSAFERPAPVVPPERDTDGDELRWIAGSVPTKLGASKLRPPTAPEPEPEPELRRWGGALLDEWLLLDGSESGAMPSGRSDGLLVPGGLGTLSPTRSVSPTLPARDFSPQHARAQPTRGTRSLDGLLLLGMTAAKGAAAEGGRRRGPASLGSGRMHRALQQAAALRAAQQDSGGSVVTTPTRGQGCNLATADEGQHKTGAARPTEAWGMLVPPVARPGAVEAARPRSIEPPMGEPPPKPGPLEPMTPSEPVPLPLLIHSSTSVAPTDGHGGEVGANGYTLLGLHLARRLFETFDLDGDAHLSVEELREFAWRTEGAAGPEAEEMVQNLLRSFRSSGRGLTFDGFLELYRETDMMDLSGDIGRFVATD